MLGQKKKEVNDKYFEDGNFSVKDISLSISIEFSEWSDYC